MKYARKYLALVLAMAMMLTLAACGSSTDSSSESSQESSDSSDKSGSDYTIGLILPIGGLGDNSIADSSYNALTAASEELGFTFDYSEPVNEQDREAMVIEYSEADEYDLIIAVGSETAAIIEQVQPDYPEQKYLAYDVQGEIPNTMSEYFSKAELGFMAGVFMAAIEPYGTASVNGTEVSWTPSGKIGLIIGNEYPNTVTAMTGAAAGIKYMNPDNEYVYGIVGGWTDQAKNKELALSMYTEGCNFIFHNAGAGSAGILSAAEERNLFMIGYDANQNYLSETNILASSYKNNADAIMRVMTEFCTNGGELAWGTSEENNYSNGGTIFTLNDGVEIPDEVMAIMEAVQSKLANGEIVVPETWDDVEAFTAVYE